MAHKPGQKQRPEKPSSKKQERFEGRADSSKETKGFEGKGTSKAQDSGASKGALGDGLDTPHSEKRLAGFSKDSKASKGALEGESDIPHSDKRFAESSKDIPIVEKPVRDPKEGDVGVPPDKKKRRRRLVKKTNKPNFQQEPPRGQMPLRTPGVYTHNSCFPCFGVCLIF